jgi:hypothetical protein
MTTEPTPTVLYLRADGPDVLFKWSTCDPLEFEEIRTDLKRCFTYATGLRFDRDRRGWVLPADERDHLNLWSRSWFSPENRVPWDDAATGDMPHGRAHAHRANGASDHAGRRGGQRGGRRTSGHTEPGGQRAGTGRAQRGASSPLNQAYSTLHLREDAPLWACEAVYRAAQKQGHPDVGGSHENAVAANRAIAVIREAHNGRASGAA